MNQPLLNAIEGKESSRYPVWFLRQAGRYLPEYRALKEKYSFLEMCQNPKIAAEVTLQPLARFDLDAAIIFADILLPLVPLGQTLNFKKDHGPLLIPPIRTEEDFENFISKTPSLEDLNYVGEALNLVRAKLPKEKSLIGFAGAPFTVATYMIEGSGTKNFHHTKRMLFGDPSLFHKIMSLLCESTKTYLKMQAEAGADLLMLFDSWASAVSPMDYKKHILPYIKELKTEVESFGKKLIYYPGQNPQNASFITKRHCDVLHLDWHIDLNLFFNKEDQGEGLSYQGNLDPQILFAKEEDIRKQTREILYFFKEKYPKRHIFNVGHGLIPEIPISSLEKVIDEIRLFRF